MLTSLTVERKRSHQQSKQLPRERGKAKHSSKMGSKGASQRRRAAKEVAAGYRSMLLRHLAVMMLLA